MTKSFCKHHHYKLLTHIRSPKWSTDEILINVTALPENTNDLVIQFSDESPKEKYGWFYMDANTVRKHPTQRNGNGMVYVVPMSKREDFVPLKKCEHEL